MGKPPVRSDPGADARLSDTLAPRVYRGIDRSSTSATGTSAGAAKGPDSDVQQLVAAGPGFALCRFHCPPGHPRWQRENRIGDGFNLVFPRGAVEIAVEGLSPFVADSTRAVVYDDGVRYRRRQLAAHGDRATVLLFARDLVARTLREVGRSEPPPSLAAPMPARLYLAQRRLRARLEHADRVDASIEREALDLLRRVLATGDGTGQDVELPGYVTRTLALLNERHSEQLSLATLAREVGVTPAHLCRAFRRALGNTVHSYLVEIRVRAAIDLLFDTRLALAEVALASGFSHQSHFTETLRKATGTTPGRLRREHDRF